MFSTPRNEARIDEQVLGVDDRGRRRAGSRASNIDDAANGIGQRRVKYTEFVDDTYGIRKTYDIV
ncbi:hypothetical protein GCM10009021_22460 [Halarchaeum nitratireducens]|uniref:Uncharacterized protein n=1 Tax=Halarchaeum nitratireducens TaxID=489913 RepID=A0A830GCD3_9EURY|nr:hypothetical protein GCM10009021_22460 [Halarchaeum nitratireducens]